MSKDFKMLRPLHGIDVRQRTKDGFISANDLFLAGNRARITQGLQPRNKMSNYFTHDDTQELCEVIKAQESIDRVRIAGRGRNATTWIHPVLAFDFALWMSPQLKYEVYKWMTDQLLLKRMESAESFKDMNIALDKRYNVGSKYWYYTNTADAIRRAVGASSWDAATEDQLKLRDKIQDRIIGLCEDHSSMPFDSLVHRGIVTTMARYLK